MDNQKTTLERQRAERMKYARIQRTIRTCAILLAIVLSLASLVQSCSTKKAIAELSEQLAAKKAAEAQAEELRLEQEAAAQAEAEALAAVTSELTISFVGDCTLGVDESFGYEDSFTEYYDIYGQTHFFENVKSIFEGDDLTIANLEGTLTLSENRADKLWAFKADPEYAGILVAGSIEAVSVANNHSHDYGNESYVDTLANLDNVGITRFGYENTRIVEVDGVSIGLVSAWEYQDGDYAAESIEQVTKLQENGADLVVVCLHWGVELQYTPGDSQVTLAHQLIDAGADIVVGHHPHVLQGIEYYNGKYIAYSLGNFCFGGNFNPRDYDTMILQVTFPIQGGAVAGEGELNIIPCKLSSTTEYNDYQPTPAEGDTAEAILSKIYELSEELTGGISRDSN